MVYSTPLYAISVLIVILALWILMEPTPWHPKHSTSGYESEHWLPIRYESTDIYEWYGLSYTPETPPTANIETQTQDSLVKNVLSGVGKVLWILLEGLAD